VITTIQMGHLRLNVGGVSLVTEVPFTVVWVAHGWQRIEAYDSVTL
jgi:hypothetical protein